MDNVSINKAKNKVFLAMIEQAIVTALIVLSIWYTMQPGEIFGRFGDWLEGKLPEVIHKPVFDCPVCMSFWYGTILYWLVPWPHSLWQWPVVVISAMGINIVINKWTPKDDD